jgi:hypothetical protein
MHNEKSLYFYALVFDMGRGSIRRSDGFFEADSADLLKQRLTEEKQHFASQLSTRTDPVYAEDIYCICLSQVR